MLHSLPVTLSYLCKLLVSTEKIPDFNGPNNLSYLWLLKMTILGQKVWLEDS
jgi:hypothetical protein